MSLLQLNHDVQAATERTALDGQGKVKAHATSREEQERRLLSGRTIRDETHLESSVSWDDAVKKANKKAAKDAAKVLSR